MASTSCCCSSSYSQEDYQNIMNNIVAVEAPMSHIDELFSYIDQFVNEKRKSEKTDGVDSSIKSAGVLLNKVFKRSKRHLCEREFKRKLNRETRKLIIDVTNQATHIKCLGVALSVVAFVLERTEQISSNTKECLQLLKYMCDLAKFIKQLEESLAQDKLNRILQFVIEGSALCISQIKSDSLSKCLAAPVTAEDLQSLRRELEHEHSDLSLKAIIAVLNRIPVVLPRSQGLPPSAVGTEETRKRVSQLLDVEKKSVIAVVIYGQGGIGKTTLATALFNKLNLKEYKFCRVNMPQNCLETDLEKLQEQILRDLFGCNIQLRSWIEGLEVLSKKFKESSSQPVFIFVDNALRENDFEKLLPITDLATLPVQSRILVTTRNLNETRLILRPGIERRPYKVPFLPPEKARKLLCEFALDSIQASFDPTIDIEGLLQICQGVPLVLQQVGARLREHTKYLPDCREAVDYLKSWLLEGENNELSERMVDFVYNRLGDSCKEAFLDIVFFFCNWNRCIVARSVGEIQLQELESAALVNITDEGRLNVHDIVQARGRKLSPDGERIIDEQSLNEILKNEEKIKKTKGICLHQPFDLEARHLNSMNKCLRVLTAWKGTINIVNGECKGTFENLRFLRLNEHNYSLMDLSKHPKLAVFLGDEFKPFEFSGLASSLRYVSLFRATLGDLNTTFSQLQSLRLLKLWYCEGFAGLPETIVKLPDLQKLKIFDCPSLVSLPDSFGQLRSLSHLRLDGCEQLSALPKSFGDLASLELLTLNGCQKLLNLPQNFGQLKRLKYLSIHGCSELKSLSGGYEFLSSLIAMKASECSQLEGDTIEKLAKMKGLMMVDIGGSDHLEKRWQQVKEHYSLGVVTSVGSGVIALALYFVFK